jgi:deazaflavin-dependent oxidoreductase (nitroreductase family)
MLTNWLEEQRNDIYQFHSREKVDLDMKSIESVQKNQYIYITTKGRRTGKPHTVQVWFAYADGKIYLSHEGAYTDWMKNLEKNEKVNGKIANMNFEAKAKIVGESNSREIGKKALYEKYYKSASKAVIDDWFSLSTVIELTPIQ